MTPTKELDFDHQYVISPEAGKEIHFDQEMMGLNRGGQNRWFGRVEWLGDGDCIVLVLDERVSIPESDTIRKGQRIHIVWS